MTQGGGVITEGEDLSLPGSWSCRRAEGVQGSPTCSDGAKPRPPAPRAQEAGLHLGSQRCYNGFGDHSGSSAKHQHSHYRWGDVKNVVFTLSLALGQLLSELQQAWQGPAFGPAAFSGCQPLALWHKGGGAASGKPDHWWAPSPGSGNALSLRLDGGSRPAFSGPCCDLKISFPRLLAKTQIF